MALIAGGTSIDSFKLGDLMMSDATTSDGTSNWSVTDASLSYETDGSGHHSGFYRITETNSSQHIRKDLSSTLTTGRKYRIYIQCRSSSQQAYSNNNTFLDLKSAGDGSGGGIDYFPKAFSTGWWAQSYDKEAAVDADEFRMLLWLPSGGTFDFRQLFIYELLPYGDSAAGHYHS